MKPRYRALMKEYVTQLASSMEVLGEKQRDLNEFLCPADLFGMCSEQKSIFIRPPTKRPPLHLDNSC